MPKKYPKQNIARFMSVYTNGHFPPAKCARTLWGITHHMSLEELNQTEDILLEYHSNRARHLKDIGAPSVLYEHQDSLPSIKGPAIRAIESARKKLIG